MLPKLSNHKTQSLVGGWFFFLGVLWTTHESKPPLPRQCLGKHFSWERTWIAHHNQAQILQTTSTVFSPNSPFLPTNTEQNDKAGDSSGGRNQTFQGALLSVSRTVRKTSVEVEDFNHHSAMVYKGVEQLCREKKKICPFTTSFQLDSQKQSC